jgi:hypothetical protein
MGKASRKLSVIIFNFFRGPANKKTMFLGSYDYIEKKAVSNRFLVKRKRNTSDYLKWHGPATSVRKASRKVRAAGESQDFLLAAGTRRAYETNIDAHFKTGTTHLKTRWTGRPHIIEKREKGWKSDGRIISPNFALALSIPPGLPVQLTFTQEFIKLVKKSDAPCPIKNCYQHQIKLAETVTMLR